MRAAHVAHPTKLILIAHLNHPLVSSSLSSSSSLSISLSSPFAHPPLRLNDSIFASATFSSSAHADPPSSGPAPTCLASLRLSPVELRVFAHRRPSRPHDCHQSHPASPLALPVSSRPSSHVLLLGVSPMVSCGFSCIYRALRPGYRALRTGAPTPSVGTRSRLDAN
ncbi:hypothetical protein CGRA01v4_09757 [Colletotrichum graminicola]|nr:hypothetical protein CGRA01v4_09757 [Colletotrichum graminicola]